MNITSWAIVVGLIIGLIDIIPMIKLKLPKYSIVAAFIHYFVATVVIFHIKLPYIPWWLMGGLVGLVLMIPMLIHVGHDNKKPLPMITANAVVLGSLAGIIAHYLI